MPLENHILRAEHNNGLLPPPLLTNSKDALNQQLALVSLGGLRSLVAAMLDIDAITFFQSKNWPELEKRYRQIVALAPGNPFYWDNAVWHLAYNAATDQMEDNNLTASQKNTNYKNYTAIGKRFLDSGIEHNPSSWKLYLRKGHLLSTRPHFIDYSAAADAYRRAVELGAPSYYKRMEFYCLARDPAKSREAWQLGRSLYNNPSNRLPTLEAILFALENRLDTPENERIPFKQLFPDTQDARQALYLYMTSNQNYPMDGIRAKLDSLPAPEEGT